MREYDTKEYLQGGKSQIFDLILFDTQEDYDLYDNPPPPPVVEPVI